MLLPVPVGLGGQVVLDVAAGQVRDRAGPTVGLSSRGGDRQAFLDLPSTEPGLLFGVGSEEQPLAGGDVPATIRYRSSLSLGA